MNMINYESNIEKELEEVRVKMAEKLKMIQR